MNEKILEKLSEIMERPITADDPAQELDSIQVVMILAMLDDFGKGDVTFARLKSCATFGDIARIV